jgi:hypothetical protein
MDKKDIGCKDCVSGISRFDFWVLLVNLLDSMWEIGRNNMNCVGVDENTLQ